MTPEETELLINLLEDTFKEEICHLRLRSIRENQRPRFEALTATPEIREDFEVARKIHDDLLKIRRGRVSLLTKWIEGPDDQEPERPPGVTMAQVCEQEARERLRGNIEAMQGG